MKKIIILAILLINCTTLNFVYAQKASQTKTSKETKNLTEGQLIAKRYVERQNIVEYVNDCFLNSTLAFCDSDKVVINKVDFIGFCKSFYTQYLDSLRLLDSLLTACSMYPSTLSEMASDLKQGEEIEVNMCINIASVSEKVNKKELVDFQKLIQHLELTTAIQVELITSLRWEPEDKKIFANEIMEAMLFWKKIIATY